MQIQLSISILLSKKDEWSVRCLDSLIPLLRGIPSELIIVCTSEDQEVLELARQYTDMVIPFTWCDDFAKARNAGLEQAVGEWFLFLDDDEWFEDVQPIVDFFQNGTYRSYNSASYQIYNYKTKSLNQYSAANVNRLAVRREGMHFQGAVHECLEPFAGPTYFLDTFVHHVGYMGVMKEKFRRNLKPLLQRVKSEKYNLVVYVQIVHEYASSHGYEKAVEWCEIGMEIGKDTRNNVNYSWISMFYVMLLARIRDGSRAWKAGWEMLKEDKLTSLARLQVCVTLSMLGEELHKTKECVELAGCFYQTMTAARQKNLSWKEQEILELTKEKVDQNQMTCYGAALTLAAEDGQNEDIKKILTYLPWEESVTYKVRDYVEAIKKEHNLLPYLAELSIQDDYIMLQKVLFSLEQHEIQRGKEYYNKTINHNHIPYMEQWVTIALQHEFDLKPIMMKYGTEDISVCFEKVVSGFVEAGMGTKQQLDLAERMEPYKEQQEIFLQLILEAYLARLGYSPIELVNEEYLLTYCRIVVNTARYIEEKRLVFARGIKVSLDYKQQHQFLESIRTLKELAEQLPSEGKIIAKISGSIQETYEESLVPQNEEMLALGEQIKPMIREMIRVGQYKEAETVIPKLMEFLPDDMEVLRMRQIILHNS